MNSEYVMRSRRKLRYQDVVFLAFGAIVALLLYFYVTSLFLRLDTYTVEADIAQPIRVVHLSDLHNAEFGANNSWLVRRIAEQKPDMIVMSGDMLNADDPETGIITALIGELSSIAPVYFGYGNHEKTWEQNYGQSVRELIEAAGAVVVDNDYVDVDLNGNSLRIGGYMGYYPVPHMTTQDKAQQEMEIRFAEEFQNTDRLKLLIDHIPTSWVDWEYVNRYPIDIVFSGHYHGGIIRIPILDQGLYAPYAGWFPQFTKGLYSGNQGTCVLSAGLGIEHAIPRLNNPPEIVVLELVPG